jgi:hypothetical protein
MRSLLAVAATAVLLTGCGTALAQSATGHSGKRPRAAVAATGVATGSRAQAQAYVRHLMAELSLPGGAVAAHLTSLPRDIRAQAPGTTGWAGASRVLIVPGQPLAVLKQISGHAPYNDPVVSEVVPVDSAQMRPDPEPGIDVVILDLAVEAHSRTTTLVGADAFAAWLPYRTAAEHLNAASFRSVTITRDQVSAKPRTESRTFTSAAVIARLVTFLNGRSPAPQSALAWLSCPAVPYTYSIRFAPRERYGPTVTASPFCLTAEITVNGKPQPWLWDTNGGLVTIAAALLSQR